MAGVAVMIRRRLWEWTRHSRALKEPMRRPVDLGLERTSNKSDGSRNIWGLLENPYNMNIPHEWLILV
jgi:hypothetical protein